MGEFLDTTVDDSIGTEISDLIPQNAEWARKLYLEGILDVEDFSLMFCGASMTTNVTKLNRVSKRRCLIYIGNGAGIIGYGKGKGPDYSDAFNKAVEHAMQNLIAIPLDYNNSCPKPLSGRHNDVILQISPSRPGNMRGFPLIHNMCTLAGIIDCKFFYIARHKNNYSLIYSFFEAIRKNVTMRELAEEKNMKVTDLRRRIWLHKYEDAVNL